MQLIVKAAQDSIDHPGANARPLPKNESETQPLLIVFRHGESEDNLLKIFSGWRDVGLTPRGVQQAMALAELLKNKKIDVCITSPLRRTLDTAKYALKYHPHIKIETDQRIIERNYGDLMGTSKEELQMKNPGLAAKYRRAYDFPPPNGESLEMVETRVTPFILELKERMLRDRINVAISCHGNSMRIIRRHFEKLTLLEMCILENPLGSDYAQYVIEKKKDLTYKYSSEYLKDLYNPKAPRSIIVPSTSN